MPTRKPRTKTRYDLPDDDDETDSETGSAGGVSDKDKDKGRNAKKQRREVVRLSTLITARQEEEGREESFLAEQEQDLPGTTRDDSVKRRLLRRLIRLKQDRKTNRECAQVLEVSERTVYNYINDPMYAEMQQEMSASARDEGHVRLAETISEAIDELYVIMKNGDSEFVRFKAAEALLNYNGYNVPREQKMENSKTEYDRFMRLVDEKLKHHTLSQVNISIHTDGPHTRNEMNALPAGPIVDADADANSEIFDGNDLPPDLQKYAITVLPGGKLPSMQRPSRDENGE